MSKEMYMAAHEDLIEEYLEAHPNATDDEAYNATADGAYSKMQDRLADIGDMKYQEMRDREMEGD